MKNTLIIGVSARIYQPARTAMQSGKTVQVGLDFKGNVGMVQ